jgi:ferredoxin like protein
MTRPAAEPVPDPANVERLLYGARYRADTETHIMLSDPALCVACPKPCLWFCPAAVYRLEGDRTGASDLGGTIRVAYENCLECGTCRVACPSDNVLWHYPTGGFGIAYRRG